MYDRRNQIINSNKSEINKALQLLKDCKNFGTLSFAHAARAGFVSVTILKSFVYNKILSKNRYDQFMQSISTVSSEFDESFSNTKKNIIEKYGHLRPGTYEIATKAYWEDSTFS